MYRMTITIYSHNFVVSDFDRVVKDHITKFSLGFAEYEYQYDQRTKRYTRVVSRIYAVSNYLRDEFRFHINAYHNFIRYMENLGFTNKQIYLLKEPMYTVTPINIALSGNKEPYDYQPPYINFLASPGISKLLPLQTGKGKTACGLFAMAIIGQRFLVNVQGKYLQRWLDDLLFDQPPLDLRSEDVLLIKSTKDLIRLIELCKDPHYDKPKCYVVTNKILYNFMDHYENTKDRDYYGCYPWELMKILDVGVMIRDEAHTDFHYSTRLECYLHIPKIISLSATMDPDTAFIRDMYSLVYPEPTRCVVQPYHRYVHAIALYYNLESSNDVRYLRRGRNSYSQTDFEKSIMKKPKLLKNYLKMIELSVKEQFMSIYEKGLKLLIFASYVEMCSAITKHLQSVYPHLVVLKYTGEDDESHYKEGEIIVSTVGSAGTAIDIKGLAIVISTSAVSKTESNLQMLGRIRELKSHPHIKTKFIYFVCLDIDKQVSYHQKKKEKFADKVLSHIEIGMGLRL